MTIAPLTLLEHEGRFSLVLECGATPVDDAIREAGHEPNGYFWEGIAQLLMQDELAEIEGAFDVDPEAGAFVAYGEDRASLERLGVALAAIANDPAQLASLVASAEADGFTFDD